MNGGNEMDKKLKRALNDVYRAPAPTRKTAFLQQHHRRELGRWELVAVQAGYIRWWIWVASLVLFGLILWTTSAQTVKWRWWGVAAFTPFLALLVVSENGRSRFYNMDELELACRIPRRSVLLSRMVVLGLFHLALLTGLTLPLTVRDAIGIVQAGVYLLTPYLLTAALSMELTRRIRGWGGLPACGSVAALVSVFGVLLANIRPALYQRENLSLWLAALTMAAVATVVEIKLNLSGTEGPQWN